MRSEEEMWQERRSPKRNRHVSELGTLKEIRTGAPFVVDPFNRQYSWRAKRPLLYVTTYGKFPLLGVVNNNDNNNKGRTRARKMMMMIMLHDDDDTVA